jgi:peptide/nickel transport system substrate-binding protein
MSGDGTDPRRGTNRSLMLGSALAAVAILSVLVATAVAAPRREAASIARKDTLVVGQFRVPTGKIGNPYVAASDAFVSDGVHQLVYEPLFYLNPQTGKEEPWLATGFAYNKTFTKISITLRKGVTWNDGVPLTSKDAVYTINQIIKTKPTPFRAGNIQASVASAKATGTNTFVVNLKQPNPRFVYTDLSTFIYTSNLTILPEHVFAGKNFKTFTDYDLKRGLPVGTGPYRVTATSQNAVTLTRNENWWAAKTGFSKLPAPKQVVFTNPGPEDTAVSQLEHNQLDYSGLNVPTVAGFITAQKQNPKLENWDGDLGFHDACPFSLTVNTKLAPFDDPQMRWAVSYAINKNQFSELFNSPGAPTPAATPFPDYPALTAYIDKNKDLLQKYPTLTYSTDQAAKILQAKGYTNKGGKWYGSDGNPLTVTVNIFSAAALGPAWENADALVKQNLEQAGFTVNLQPNDFNGVIAARNDGVAGKATWNVQSWFECGSLTDPWSTLNRYSSALGNDNAGGWSNAEYNSIVQQMGQLRPTDARIPGLFRRAFEIYLRELPVIPLIQRPEPVVMNRAYWTGWPTAATPYEPPAAWTQYFHQVVLRLKATGGK